MRGVISYDLEGESGDLWMNSKIPKLISCQDQEWVGDSHLCSGALGGTIGHAEQGLL